jgi:putative Mg2+ transporter-C (MgtC) family protein
MLDGLTHSLWKWLPSPWAELVLALASVACGAIVGSEREQRDKPAGLRTLILVCLGSAVFTMASFIFTTTTGDSGRVAAQIVTGIGFLGAGAILHSKTTVSGMTTAATVWVTAAIGVTVGGGYPAAGLGLSALVRMVLAGILGWEIRHLGGIKSVVVEIVYDPDHGKTKIRLAQMREEYRIERYQMTELTETMGGCTRARLELSLPRRQLHEFLNGLVGLPALREIRELTST